MATKNLASDDIDILNSAKCFMIFAGDDGQAEGLRKAVDANAGSFPDYKYFYADGNLAERVRDFVGIAGEDTKAAVISVKDQKHFVYSGDRTEASVKQWLSDIQAGVAKPYRKSGARPPNDRDPEHLEIYKLTADSFDEVVMNSNIEFLVDLWADWCGPCVAVAPTLELLSEVIADIPTIKIGKMNVDENASDRELFPETSIPNMKFFANGNKKTPLKYQGTRTLVDFVEFIHKNAQTKFDLAQYKGRAEALMAMGTAIKSAKALVKKTEEQINRHVSALSVEEKSSIVHELNALKDELAKKHNASESQLSAKIKALSTSPVWTTLKAAEKKFKEEEEIKSLKNVKKMHSDEEYDTVIAQAAKDGKNVIVDCFATWCGPCVFISPVFGALSEKFTNLVFVKIDVDQQTGTAAKLGIQAMPTFKVIAKGGIVDELVGADPKGLEELCKKYNK